jgi:hypothetical protein
MKHGTFTGKKLEDYINSVPSSEADRKSMYRNARRVVNGQNKAEEFAGHAVGWEATVKTCA